MNIKSPKLKLGTTEAAALISMLKVVTIDMFDGEIEQLAHYETLSRIMNRLMNVHEKLHFSKPKSRIQFNLSWAEALELVNTLGKVVDGFGHYETSLYTSITDKLFQTAINHHHYAKTYGLTAY